MRFARYKCDITAWLWTRPDPIKKGGKRGQANLKMVKPLVKLPRLDSNQQPFG
jgi:hypothetical protein